MDKKFIIIGIIIVSLSSLFVFLNYPENTEKTNKNITEIENASAEVKNLDISKNILPNFKIGKIYEYKITPLSGFLSFQQPNLKEPDIKINDKLYIKGIDRFNKSDCFVIVGNLTQYTQNQLVEKEERFVCIDENGIARYFITNIDYPGMGNHSITYYGENASKFLEISSFLGKFLYGEWMLHLNDNYENTFEINFTRKQLEITYSKGVPILEEKPVDEIHKIFVSVEGRERIQNRECFKVEVKI
ncbi:MAG: hypothetical protein CVT89_02740 [Candidatus Altiarchaeales archaeon HGW-Altiarchaeales-2]|nr:MAG: hypothetical protein CVT89_02740 [Candidatus Altiarchaeales archaeon HGW-Altiarchaeales-2]